MKKVLTLLSFCCLTLAAKSQSLFCGHGDTCADADVLCGEELDGYFGNTTAIPPIPVPIPGFCGTIENPEWIGFVPCLTDVVLQVNNEFCDFVPPFDGLQAAIIQTDDCQNFVVLACVEQILEGESATIIATGLIPGQVYYLMLDGFNGDDCNYTIDVLEGINTVNPEYEVVQEGFIDGPNFIPCPAGLASYTVELPICEATNTPICTAPAPIDDCFEIDWMLPPGATFVGDSTGLTITVDFSNATSGELSVEFLMDDGCECYCDMCPVDEIPPIFITVEQPVVTTLPLLELCTGNEFDFCGTTYFIDGDETFSCQTGSCEFTLQPVTAIPGVEVEISQTGSLSTDPFVLLENIFFEMGAPETYLWQGPGVATSSAYTFEATLPGIYSLTVTDTLTGCTAIAQTVVLPEAICQNSDSPVPPGDDCSDAPPFCEGYLNSYCSVNDFYTPDTPGNLQSMLSCTIENNQWLSFVACDPEVILNIEVSNCLGAEGLEFSVLQSADCQLFDTLANCVYTPMGDTAMIEMVDLNPGERYLLMVDGINGDICQWNVVSTTGVSNGGLSQEDNTPGEVIGPDDVCLDSGPVTLTFSFTMPICNVIDLGGCPDASQQVCEPHLDTCITYQYDTVWHVDPPVVGSAPSGYNGGTFELVLDPDSIDIPPGQQFVEIEVSVDPFHLVNTGADTTTCWDNCLIGCGTILPDPEGDECIVKPKKFKVCKPDEEEYFFTICSGECVDFMSYTFCAPGVYVIEEEDPCGCMDMFTIYIDEISPIFPIVGPETIDCAPDGSTYTVSFELIAFGQWDFMVNGDFVPQGTYTSDPIPSGVNYVFEIEAYDWYCGFQYLDEIAGVHQCPCPPSTEDLGTIELCVGECYELGGMQFCSAGSYEEVVVDAMTGCEVTYLFTLDFLPQSNLQSGPVTELCNATNTDYTVTFTILDGIEPYFVNGNPAGGSTYTSAPIPTGQPYFFEVTDSDVCEENSFTLEGIYECECITDPGTMANSLLSTCEEEMVSAIWNNDATLDGNDILIFVMHTGAGASLGDIVGMNTTGTFGFDSGSMSFGQTYYISAVAGNDAGGTVDMADACLGVSPGQSVVFYENPMVDILPSGTLIDCIETSVLLTDFPSGGSGQFTYQWNGPGISDPSSPSQLVTEGGIYTLLLTDNLSGCTVDAVVEIEEDLAEPEFEIVPPTQVLNCAVTSVDIFVTSQQAGLTYEWTLPNGATASGTSISATEVGAYTVVATALNGCTAALGTDVSGDFLPPENIQATSGTITCAQPVVALQGSSLSSDDTYSWILPSGNTQLGGTISTSEPGSYTLIATGTNGCTAETTTTVGEDILPPANVQATSGDLNCDLPVITLEASSSTPDVTFDWIFPTGNQSAGPTVVTDISGQYTITATGLNGCATTVQSNVGEDFAPPANVQATGGELTCDEPTAELTVTSSTPDVTFSWTYPSGNQEMGASISTSQGGEYTVIATGANGCTSEVQSTLLDSTEPPEDVDATNGEITCAEPTATLEASSSTPDVTFTWLLPNGDEITGQSISTGQAGGYTITATAPNGCFVEVPATVTEDTAAPDLILSDGFVNCEQPEATLTAFSNMLDVTFTWELPNGGIESGIAVTSSLTGDYEVVAIAPNGCETVGATEIAQAPDPAISAIVDMVPPTCFGDEDASITIESVVGGTEPHQLTINGQQPPGNGLDGLTPGIYEVAVTDVNGCKGDTLIEILEPEEVFVEIGDDQFIDLGESVGLEFETNIQPSSILWTGPFGQTWEGLSSVSVSPVQTGTYRIVIADVNSCTAEDELTIFVAGEGTVYVPNAFSPNGDQVNDVLTIFAGADVSNIRSFQVFDRWGEVVFEGENFSPNDLSRGWDGRLNGKLLDPAVFVYLAEVEFLTGEVKVISGDVLLLK